MVLFMPRAALVLLCSLLCLSALLSPPLNADTAAEQAELAQRIHDASQAVVATVGDVRPYFHRNEYGDELIVSRVSLQVSEVLRGQPPAIVPLDVEGGTLNGLTLEVSDMPTLQPGDRGVFLLDRDSAGRTMPHHRGLGILLLDDNDTVRGSSVRLDDVRQAISEAQR
jgi:hypothetical protein